MSMAATGAFAPTNYDFLRSRMIMPTPKVSTLTPTAPTMPVNRLPVAPPRTPLLPPTTVIGDPIIPVWKIIPDTFGSGGAPPPTPPPTVTSPATGATTGDNTGSTGTSDLSRLLDLFGGTFAPKELTPALAPTSVVETGTSDAAPSGGGTNYTMIIVVLVLLGGGFWYVQHRKAA
jgi:hypothetical protein